MDIRKTDTITPDYDHLLQDERFQSWIVNMLIEDAQKIDPRVEDITQRQYEHEADVPSQ
ncbi:MAG: hypothetical protein K8I82_31390 [Anaerolineae bacterium]|nr:hypothetical protein [Anaerolineae bacterium]